MNGVTHNWSGANESFGNGGKKIGLFLEKFWQSFSY